MRSDTGAAAGATTIETTADGEYQITCGWTTVQRLQSRLRDGDLSALWGVGAALGRAVLFGRPASFDSRGTVISFTISPTTAVPHTYDMTHPNHRASELTSFAEVPLQEIDPRDVQASQRGLQHGAMFHYLTGKYSAGGELFDKTRPECNDWPVFVHDTETDVLTIRQGHHRSTAALLNGEPIRGRVVPSRPAAETGVMTAVTPLIWIGDCHFDHVRPAAIHDAIEQVSAGNTVVLESLDRAGQVLRGLGTDLRTTDYRLARAADRLRRSRRD